jgi:hypothetical protein
MSLVKCIENLNDLGVLRFGKLFSILSRNLHKNNIYFMSLEIYKGLMAVLTQYFLQHSMPLSLPAVAKLLFLLGE